MKVTTALFGHTEKDESPKPKSQVQRTDESVARRIQREALEKGSTPSNFFTEEYTNVSDRERRWMKNAETEKLVEFNEVLALYHRVQNLRERMEEFSYRSIEFEGMKICLEDINIDFVNYGFGDNQKVEVNLWIMGTNVNINIQCFTNNYANVIVLRHSEKPNAVLYDPDIVWMSDEAVTHVEERIHELMFATSKEVYDYILTFFIRGTMKDPIVVREEDNPIDDDTISDFEVENRTTSMFDMLDVGEEDEEEIAPAPPILLDKFNAIFPQQHHINWYSISLNTDKVFRYGDGDSYTEFTWLYDAALSVVRSRTDHTEIYDLVDWLESYFDDIKEIHGCEGFDGYDYYRALEEKHFEESERKKVIINHKIEDLKRCKEYVLKVLEFERNMSNQLHKDGEMLMMRIKDGKTLKVFIDMFGRQISDTDEYRYHEDILFNHDLYENAYNVIKSDREYNDRKNYEDYMGDYF